MSIIIQYKLRYTNVTVKCCVQKFSVTANSLIGKTDSKNLEFELIFFSFPVLYKSQQAADINNPWKKNDTEN